MAEVMKNLIKSADDLMAAITIAKIYILKYNPFSSFITIDSILVNAV